MSQKASYKPPQRFQLVKAVKIYLEENGGSVKQACRAVGVSPTNYRRWRDALYANPDFVQQKAIEIESRSPKRFARQVGACTKQRIIDMANQPEHTSANSITKQLKNEGITIGTAKVIEILEEEGLVWEIQKRMPAVNIYINADY